MTHDSATAGTGPQGAAVVRGVATGVAARAVRVVAAIGATSKASGALST